MTRRIDVNLGRRSYQVVIDNGKSFAVRSLVRKQHPDQVFAVFDTQLFALHGKTILRDIEASGLPVKALAVPMSEKAKNKKTLDDLHQWLLSERISRADMIIACGGGVTTDVVGFAAATIMRGVAWGAIPTTLIGMIDAAIGGKTGINHALAKNAVGAFWQPQFVYGYVPVLQTLPPRHLHAGIGELVKYAGLIGEPFLTDVRTLIDSEGSVGQKDWMNLIATAARYKASLVSSDERDTGVRQFLNLGHTFAHGIEQSLGYGKLLHGEAVAIGLLAACNLSDRVIPGAGSRLEAFRNLVEATIFGIPGVVLAVDEIMASMQLDKKRSGRTARFILLNRPGNAVVKSGVDLRAVRHSLLDAIRYYDHTRR